MLIYPPFQRISRYGITSNVGYNWIFSSPIPGSINPTVNVPMLLIQWVGVLIVGGISFFLANNSTKEPRRINNGAISSSSQESDIEIQQPIEATNTLSSTSNSFRDPTRLTQSLRFLLYVYILIYAISIFSNVMQYQLLSDFKLGIYSSGALATTVAEANDKRQMIIGLCQLGVTIPVYIFFAMWIYRANFNVRALGAQNMKFSPGWSIGCQFVPIINLWYPYQAMKEIWKASKNPLSWKIQECGLILPLWWFLIIVCYVFGNMFYKATLKSNDIDRLIRISQFSIAIDIMTIIIAFISIIIIKQIYEMQMLNSKLVD